MKKKIGLVSIFLALCLAGCATTSNSGGSHSGASSSSGEAAVSDGNVMSGSVGVTKETKDVKLPDVSDSCKASIVDFIRKTDGTIEVLTSDGMLHSIDTLGGVQNGIKLSDSAENYRLLPTAEVIMHFKPDSIMVESSVKTLEFFKLAADPSKKKVYYSSDATELALATPKGTFVVWKTEKGFGGIKTNERVQEFINRQSPDHQLGFPGDVTALSIGNQRHLAVALNETDTGKIGRLFHYDPGNVVGFEGASSSNKVKSTTTSSSTGVLKNLARTNTPVVDVAISQTSMYVAAVDETGQFYFTDTVNPGFVVFSRGYKDIKSVLFNGEVPVLVGKTQLTALDPVDGTPKFAVPIAYDRCIAASNTLYCTTAGYLDVRSPNNGTLYKRYVFNGEQYGIFTEDKVEGNLPSSCLH